MGFEVGIKDIIDIFIVAVLMYQSYKVLRKSGGVTIFIGILVFLISWFFISYIFKLELLGSIFDRIISVGVFGLIVLFQDEIKRFFTRIGSRRLKQRNFIRRLLGFETIKKEQIDLNIVQIVLACSNMSKNSTGALIIITKTNNLEIFSASGEQLNANISSRLIENIFFKNSPLHDGAMIISNQRIKAAGCILPISKNHSIPKRVGLRHRAALGITEQCDAAAIVVSEETGQISYAFNGKLTLNVKPEELEHFLSRVLS